MSGNCRHPPTDRRRTSHRDILLLQFTPLLSSSTIPTLFLLPSIPPYPIFRFSFYFPVTPCIVLSDLQLLVLLPSRKRALQSLQSLVFVRRSLRIHGSRQKCPLQTISRPSWPALGLVHHRQMVLVRITTSSRVPCSSHLTSQACSRLIPCSTNPTTVTTVKPTLALSHMVITILLCPPFRVRLR